MRFEKLEFHAERKSNGEGTRRDIISFDLGSLRRQVILGLLDCFDE